MTDYLEKAKAAAEARFTKPRPSATAGSHTAMQDYVAEGEAQREKTARLKALRLAAEAARAEAAPAPKKASPKKKPTRP
jgi:hypothetical protein